MSLARRLEPDELIYDAQLGAGNAFSEKNHRLHGVVTPVGALYTCTKYRRREIDQVTQDAGLIRRKLIAAFDGVSGGLDGNLMATIAAENLSWAHQQECRGNEWIVNAQRQMLRCMQRQALIGEDGVAVAYAQELERSESGIEVEAVHCGDSRVYVVSHDRTLLHASDDHTLANVLAKPRVDMDSLLVLMGSCAPYVDFSTCPVQRLQQRKFEFSDPIKSIYVPALQGITQEELIALRNWLVRAFAGKKMPRAKFEDLVVDPAAPVVALDYYSVQNHLGYEDPIVCCLSPSGRDAHLVRRTYTVQPGASLFVCSDGLTKIIDDGVLENLVTYKMWEVMYDLIEDYAYDRCSRGEYYFQDDIVWGHLTLE